MIFTPERSQVLLVLVQSLIDSGVNGPPARSARGEGR